MRLRAHRFATVLIIVSALTSSVIADDERPLRSLFTKTAPAADAAPRESEASLRKTLRQDIEALVGGRTPQAAQQALQRLLARLAQLPSDNARLDPTQQAIANVYRADPTRGHLVSLSIELLTWDRTKHFGGQQKDQFPSAVQIFRALGIPKDVPGWQISARQGIELYAADGVERKIGAATEVARAVWAVGQRAGDNWPNMVKEISPFTFVWAFHNHDSFRPTNWAAHMRSAVDTHQPDYLRIYAFNHTPVPLTLTGSLDDSNVENLALLIEFAMRHEQNSSGPLQPVQLAAVNLAGRSRSLYFVPTIRELRDKTDSPELQRAAEAALKACTRPAAVVTPSPETSALLELDTQRIDEIFETWKADTGTPRAAELRTLIGLDYGDDRAAWLRWWERDQQSRKMCRDGKRRFLYRGRVLDDRGQAIAGATVSFSVAGEFSYHRYSGPIAAWVDTDRKGRFLIRCDFGKADRDRRGIYSAVLNVNRPGYYFLAATGPLKRYFTEHDLQHETLIQITPDELVHPRSAVAMDIVLRPAAQVEVSVVNAAGEPVKAANIATRWVELHPEESSPVGYCGCCDETWASELFIPDPVQRNQPRSVYLSAESPGMPPDQVRPTIAPYAELSTDPTVSFYFSQFRPGVSRRFAMYLMPKAKEPDAISNAVTLPAAGHYHVRLTWNPAAAPEQRLRAEVTATP